MSRVCVRQCEVHMPRRLHTYVHHIVEQIHDSIYRTDTRLYIYIYTAYICPVEYMYGVATMSRLLKMMGLFCKRAL